MFSHLSPEYLGAWLDYLLGLLHPGGHLVITTRGREFVDTLARDEREGRLSDVARLLPPSAELLDRYEKGLLQFYPTGGGGELSSGFYGEAIVPRGYFEDRYGQALRAFVEHVPHISQAIVVLQK